jgi:hypothetical protein
MSDDASKTLGGGVRAWLGTGGFLLMMFGGYFLYEHNNLSIGIPMIVGGLPLFILPWAWDRFVARFRASSFPQKLEYLHNRDSQLGPAIISMARQSAWGRWYAAQHLVNSGTPISLQMLYQIAAGEVMQKITDGDLEVRGRRPDPEQLGFEQIDRTHWQSSWPMCVQDQFSIWKIVIGPKGGVELDRNAVVVRADNPTAAKRTSLLDYDLLLVDAFQFERLWPQKDKLADRERKKLLCKARWRGLDKDEIRRLS